MLHRKDMRGISQTDLTDGKIANPVQWFADTVKMSFRLLNMMLRCAAKDYVRIDDKSIICERVVYNLRVEDANEFVANGILVHNCDALMYCLEYANRGSSLNFAQLREKYPSPPGITAGLRQRIF